MSAKKVFEKVFEKVSEAERQWTFEPAGVKLRRSQWSTHRQEQSLIKVSGLS
jgi:hypothetical protein